MPDQIAPSTPLLSRVREILSMLLLEHCCRVDHVDLVLTSLAMYVYHYEAPVALCLVVHGKIMCLQSYFMVGAWSLNNPMLWYIIIS